MQEISTWMTYNDFSETTYENIKTIVISYFGDNSVEFKDFIQSWKAVELRFIAFTEQDEIYTPSIQNFGDAPQTDERIKQDNSLFFFFISGISVFDSYSYAIHGLVSSINQNFKIQPENRINFTTVSQKFKSFFPDESLTNELLSLSDSTQFIQFKEIRNYLTHRVHPGRVLYLSGGSNQATPAEWNIGGNTLTLDNDFTKNWRLWLSTNLDLILTKTEEFAYKYFR